MGLREAFQRMFPDSPNKTEANLFKRQVKTICRYKTTALSLHDYQVYGYVSILKSPFTTSRSLKVFQYYINVQV